MTAEEDHLYATKGTYSDPLAVPLRSAALAAGLLENACMSRSGDPLRLEILRTLTRDLKEELEILAALAHGEAGVAWIEAVEGALRAADVANLAACAVPELPEARAPQAAAATYLAAGALRALTYLLEAGTENSHECQVPYALKDTRGAMWRAQLAVRQVDGFSSVEGYE